MSRPFRVNEEIQTDEVLLFDEHRQKVGVVPTPEALRRARAVSLDLVEIDPDRRPPVCRILDLEAFLRTREGERSILRTRSVRVRVGIGEEALARALARARRFLEGGEEVEVYCSLRSRELASLEQGRVLLGRLAEALAEISRPDGQPDLVKRSLLLRLLPRR